MAKRLCYACDSCGTHVYPQAGTILQDSRTPLVYWFRAIFLMATTRMGIAAKHLEREVGCSYKTAWRMMRMIRKLMTDDISELTELLGHVEIDESYFGGKAKNTHIDPETGWHTIPEKTPVLGIVQRGGNMVTHVIKEPTGFEILPRVRKHVLPKSMIFTDEARVYRNLPKMGYEHERVYHSANIYVEGDAHTNTVESFWSIAKNGIRGANRHVGSRVFTGLSQRLRFPLEPSARRGFDVPRDCFAAAFFSPDSDERTRVRNTPAKSSFVNGRLFFMFLFLERASVQTVSLFWKGPCRERAIECVFPSRQDQQIPSEKKARA